MSRITRIGPKPAPLLAVRAEQSAVPLRDRRPEIRAGFAAQFEQTAAYLPTFTEIVTEEPAIPADAGQPDVPVRTYRPRDAGGPLPALLWIHGGYVIGSVRQDDVLIKQIPTEVVLMVVSVKYRPSPTTPYPGLLHEKDASPQWLRLWEVVGIRCRVVSPLHGGTSMSRHLDVGGAAHWSWWAVEEHGVILDVYLQRHRETKAARSFFTLFLGEQGIPVTIHTDKLRSCGAALRGGLAPG